MDAELKAKWIAALRSGEYKQATGMLRDEGCYCCLGVLAVVQDAPASFFERHACSIGPSQSDAAEWPTHWIPLATASTLSEMNDGGADFPSIADHIEKNL